MTWYQSNYNSDGEKQLDQVLPSSRSGILVMTNGLKHVLRFNSVRDSDLGVYTCRAENPLGRAEAAVEMSGNKISFSFNTPGRYIISFNPTLVETRPLSRRPSFVTFPTKRIWWTRMLHDFEKPCKSRSDEPVNFLIWRQSDELITCQKPVKTYWNSS